MINAYSVTYGLIRCLTTLHSILNLRSIKIMNVESKGTEEECCGNARNSPMEGTNENRDENRRAGVTEFYLDT
jgi:hypothetical protein